MLIYVQFRPPHIKDKLNVIRYTAFGLYITRQRIIHWRHMMTTNIHPFQKWVNDNNVKDVIFYPKNPAESSASSLLDDAYNAIMSYENNECIPYVDNTPNTFVGENTE